MCFKFNNEWVLFSGKLFFFFVVFLSSGCVVNKSDNTLKKELSIARCGEGLACPQTNYPVIDQHMKDYDTQVKLGFPIKSNAGASIWVKGSSNYSSVKIIKSSNGVVIDEQQGLDTQFYVHLFEGLDENTNYIVEFVSNRDAENKKYSITTSSYRNMNSGLNNSEYSIAFYGCFQPFSVKSLESNVAGLYYPEYSPTFPTQFLKYFKEVTVGERHNYIQKSLPNTKLLVGTGDQVYMDAGYEGYPSSRTNSHPISAWTTDEAIPVLKRVKSENIQLSQSYGTFDDHVEKTYRAFGAFQELNEVFQKIPQVNAWDDHEIRDGWGSHGDEYRNGILSPELASTYRAARSGYVQHQLLAGPALEQLKLKVSKALSDSPFTNKSLHQTFSLGKYEGFVLDLRSNRNKNHETERVLGKEQKLAFSNWLNIQKRKENQHILVVSSMPLFLKNNSAIEGLASLSSGLKDDLLDGWHSKKNTKDRRWLLSLLLDARLKGVRPVFVSGDYHKGAISEIWYGKEKDNACDTRGEDTKFIFGYEMLASGLFHEGLAKGLIGKAFDRAESQRVGQHMERGIKSNENEEYCLDPHVETSAVRENFGGITINDHDENMSDELKLFTGIDKMNSTSLFSLKMDWDKKFIKTDEKQYRSFWKYWSMLPFTKDTFVPKGGVRNKGKDICLSDFSTKGNTECH